MEITPEVVKKVAANARITLKEEELMHFAKEMKDILTTFEKLSEVDTKGVKPSFHPIPITNVLEEDEERPSLLREDALSLTPHRTRTHFRGPKV